MAQGCKISLCRMVAITGVQEFSKAKGWVEILGLQVWLRLKTWFVGYIRLRKQIYSCKVWRLENNAAL